MQQQQQQQQNRHRFSNEFLSTSDVQSVIIITFLISISIIIRISVC